MPDTGISPLLPVSAPSPAPPPISPVPRRWGVVDTTRAVKQRVAVAAISVAAGALVLWRDPGQSGNYPTCPFYAVTGCYCPGCGSMRATRALLTGDIASVFTYNALFLPALLIVLWWLVTGMVNGSGKTRNILIGAGVVVVFAVLRNTPIGDFLAPAAAS